MIAFNKRAQTWVALALLALPLTLVWVGFSDQFNVGSVALGYAVGLLVLRIAVPGTLTVHVARLPGQVWALLRYVVVLLYDIAISSVQVARVVLSPKMPLALGVLRLEVGDPDQCSIVAALCANAISLTPGELVIDTDGNRVMYVHTINIHNTLNTAPAEQARRVALLRTATGKDELPLMPEARP